MMQPAILRDIQALLEPYLFISTDSLVALGVLVTAALLLVIALVYVGQRRAIPLRPITPYTWLKRAVTEAAESGRTLHLSAGTGTLGDTGSAGTLAGVTAVEALAGRAATSQASFVLTTPNPVVLPVLQAVAERAYEDAGAAPEYNPLQVRFAGENRLAYATNVADNLAHENPAANVLIGPLGDEVLLMAERARSMGVPQVVGTPSLQALPYAAVAADHLIIGEDVFAAGAYLAGRRAHLASLVAQDWLRIAVVAVIVIGVIVKTAGL